MLVALSSPRITCSSCEGEITKLSLRYRRTNSHQLTQFMKYSPRPPSSVFIHVLLHIHLERDLHHSFLEAMYHHSLYRDEVDIRPYWLCLLIIFIMSIEDVVEIWLCHARREG